MLTTRNRSYIGTSWATHRPSSTAWNTRTTRMTNQPAKMRLPPRFSNVRFWAGVNSYSGAGGAGTAGGWSVLMGASLHESPRLEAIAVGSIPIAPGAQATLP